MAKRAKTKRGSEEASDRDDERAEESERPSPDAPEELARVRTRNTIVISIFVALCSASIGYVGWHRPRDPGRLWVKGVEERHAQRVRSKLSLCFGGESAAAIRSNIAEVRRGTLPAPLKNCRGVVLTELVAIPLAVASELGTCPGYAENGKRRAWDAYSRLQVSLRAYERAIAAVPDGSATVPEAARDTLASALDDVASDADAAHNVVTELRNVVEENASWY
jgi:hypothetical protein